LGSPQAPLFMSPSVVNQKEIFNKIQIREPGTPALVEKICRHCAKAWCASSERHEVEGPFLWSGPLFVR
jgi:hypothetical protein